MEHRTMLEAGYKTFTGRILTQSDCDAYNRVQADINKRIDNGVSVPEFMLNESHRLFSILAGCFDNRITAHAGAYNTGN